MKSCLRMIFVLTMTLSIIGCATAKTTPSLTDFDNTTPPNQDAIQKLEAGTTY